MRGFRAELEQRYQIMRRVHWPTAVWLFAVVAVVVGWMVATGSLRRLLPGSPFRYLPPALLEQEVSLDSRGQSARQVLERLASMHGTSIQLDPTALEEAGLDGNEPVQLEMQNVPLGAAIVAVTRAWNSNSQFVMTVDSEGVLITNVERANSARDAHSYLYTLEDLAVRVPDFDEQELAIAIEGCFAGDWRAYGGNGYLEPLPGALLVGHGSYCHSQISDLLNKLPVMFGRPEQFVPWLPIDRIDASWHLKILDTLDRNVTWDIKGESLEAVLQRLSDQHKIPIWIRWVALEKLKPRDGWRVDFKCQRVPLHVALDRLVKSCGLRWTVDHGTVCITGRQDVDREEITVRLYNIADLVASDPRISSESLRELVQETIHPDSWDWVGGFGFAAPCCGGLLVRQAAPIHSEIEGLLRRLRRALLPPNLWQPEARAQSPIDRALQKRVDVDYQDVPLQQAFERLEPLLAVPIEFSEEVVERGTLANRVSLYAHGVPAFQVLEQLTSHFYLEDLVRDYDRIRIVLPSGYDVPLDVRVYDVGYLLRERTLGISDAGDLGEVLTLLVDVESWNDVGGMGVAKPLGDALVVGQTRRVHREIERLLATIESIADRGSGGYFQIGPRDGEAPAGPRPSPVEKDLGSPGLQVYGLYPQLEKKLKQVSRLEFVNVSLHDFVRWVGEQHSLPIILYQQEIDKFPFRDPSPAFTVSSHEMPLETALETALRPFDLTFQVRHGVVCIVPYVDYDPPTEIRLYSLLLDEPQCGYRPVELAHLLSQTLATESWNDEDGKGAADPLGNLVWVRQSRAVHAEIEALLSALALDRQPDGGRQDATSTDFCLAGPELENKVDMPLDLVGYNVTAEALLARIGLQVGLPIVPASSNDRRQLARLKRPLNLPVDQMSCRSALSYVLSVADLVPKVDRGIVWLKSADWAQDEQITRVYQVNDLKRHFGLTDQVPPLMPPAWKWVGTPRFHPGDSGPSPFELDSSGLVNLVRTCARQTNSDAWSQDDDSNRAVLRVVGDSLVATDTRDGHARIAECLTALRDWAGLPCASHSSDNDWLSQLVSLHCREQPLGEALDQLARENELPMVVRVDTTPPDLDISVIVVNGDWDNVPLARLLEEISPAAPLHGDCREGIVKITWRDPTPDKSVQFLDVADLLEQYPELSRADLADLIHGMVPRLRWDEWEESGDLCVLGHCLAIYHRPDVGKQVQACLGLLRQFPEHLPRPAVVRHADSQMAVDQLRQFFSTAAGHSEWNSARRLEVSYALVMTNWLNGSPRVAEDYLRSFGDCVLEIDSGDIDWQFCNVWQRVSKRPIDVWDVLKRLAGRPLSLERRRKLVRWLMTSGLDIGSLVGRMLDNVPQDQVEELISALKSMGPAVPSALPYLFPHLDGPSGHEVVDALHAIDPTGRNSWNVFRDMELEADASAREKILKIERILRRQFGAPEK